MARSVASLRRSYTDFGPNKSKNRGMHSLKRGRASTADPQEANMQD
jgi:hypothetical protein